MVLLFEEDEMVRLHSAAYTAAIQTGAEGAELDEVIADIFRTMARQVNRAVIKAQSPPKLRLINRAPGGYL